MLTIGTLIQNIAKGQSGIPTRMIFAQLDQVYLKLKPGIKILKVESAPGGTFVYMIVPSQSDMSKHYDIVFYFVSETTLNNNTKFRVYSNSPNFGFSYAYLFHKEGSLLFPEKYPRIMITQPPKVRNPFQVTGFDKHVYAGMHFVHKQNLKALATMSKSTSAVDVTRFEDKMKEMRIKK